MIYAGEYIRLREYELLDACANITDIGKERLRYIREYIDRKESSDNE